MSVVRIPSIQSDSHRLRNRRGRGCWTGGCLSAALFVPGIASAVTPEVLIRFGYENGGDDIATLDFGDGDTEKLKAGGELFIEGGTRLYWSEVPLADRIGDGYTRPPLSGETLDSASSTSLMDRLETELSIGYKTASVSADNGDVKFDRFTAQALQFYRFGSIRLGAGLTWHYEPELEIDFDTDLPVDGVDGAVPRSVKADNALGAIVAIDYSFDSRFHIGLRSTFIDYETDNGTSRADSVGFYAGASF